MRRFLYLLAAACGIALGLAIRFSLPGILTVLAQAPACQNQGTWETRAPLPILATEVASASIEDKIYVLGGYLPSGGDSNRLFIYDALTDSWSEGAPLPVPDGVDHANVAAFEDKLYFLGGLRNLGNPTGQTFEYDPATNVWTERASMPTARGAAGVAVSDRIYVAGGLTNSGSVAIFEAFEPRSNTWAQLPPMPTPRDHLTAQVACVRASIGVCRESRLFAIAGRINGVNTGANEAFDYENTGTWSGRAPLPTPRSGLGSAVYQSTIHVFGGETSSTASGTFEQNEAYGAGTDSWCAAASMPTPRHGFYAAGLRRLGEDPGPVFTVSGGPQAGAFFSNLNEVFFLPPAFGPVVAANGVVNAASYGSELAPGSIASLFGSFLTYRPLMQPRQPLPTQWNGVQVLVNGRPAPLLYLSERQINFIIPRNTPSPATFVVNKGGVLSQQQIIVPLLSAAPGVFAADSSGRGQGAILHANTAQLANAVRPARAGDLLEIYLTGLNVCEPEEVCILVVPQVTIGGIAAPLQFSGNAPGSVGLNQINILVPAGVAPGPAVPVRVTALGRVSNEVTIAVQ